MKLNRDTSDCNVLQTVGKTEITGLMLCDSSIMETV